MHGLGCRDGRRLQISLKIAGILGGMDGPVLKGLGLVLKGQDGDQRGLGGNCWPTDI